MSFNYKEIDTKTLNKLHHVELEILNEIDRICVSNNIEYFLIGGTLLGAIRHKGFIPWDDDLDIAMTRDNYEKFINIAIDELDSKYYLDNYKTNPNCYLPFTKVRKNNTIMDEESTSHINNHKGIFVDIFPFDNLKNKDSFFTLLRVVSILSITESIFVKKGVYSSFFKACRYPMLSLVFSVFPVRKLFAIQEKMCKKDDDSSQYYASLIGSYGFKKECFLKAELFPLIKAPFEGKEYFIFKNYDSFLNSVYGDYMEIPPKDKRINHSVMNIDFNCENAIKFNSKSNK
jgi:lipopolysaccharide cholinephosphotransferase